MKPIRNNTLALSLVIAAVGALNAPDVHALPPSQQSYLQSLDADTQAAVAAELADCPQCTLETLPDGSPNVIVPSAEASVGVTDMVFAPATYLVAQPAATCVSTTGSITKDASYERTLGNSYAGLFWRTRSTSASLPLSNGQRRTTAHAEQAVGGKLLTFSFDVARTEADALGDTGGARSLSAKVLARSTSTGLMQTVGTKSSSTSGYVTLDPISTNRTYFGGSKTFTVGPVPLTVSAYLRGQASHRVNGRTASNEASVTGNPNASLYVDAAANVEAYVAAFGADAQLTLLSGSVPASARMTKGSSSYSWNLTSNASFNALAGWIKAWVRIGYWKLSKTWRHTIAEWPGFTWTTSLFSQSGSQGVCGSVVASPGAFLAY